MEKMFKLAIFALVVCNVAARRSRAEVPDCGPGSPEHVPHPTDCTKYYTCINGEAILMDCPPGLWWSELIEGCDYPEASLCGVDVPDCDPGSPEHVPHPTDCTKYFTCLNGEPILMACPPGLWFSPVIDGCDYPENVDCVPGGSTTTGGSTNGTTSGTTTPSSTAPTEPPEGLPTSCPAVEDPNNVIRIPHETMCEWYYRCVAGNPHLYSCPDNEHFSPTKRACREQTAAGCATCPTVDEEGDIARLPHESDCHLYYLCVDGTPELYQCHLDWHFSRSIRDCMDRLEAKCNL